MRYITQQVNSQFVKLTCWRQEKWARVRILKILIRAKLWWLVWGTWGFLKKHKRAHDVGLAYKFLRAQSNLTLSGILGTPTLQRTRLKGSCAVVVGPFTTAQPFHPCLDILKLFTQYKAGAISVKADQCMFKHVSYDNNKDTKRLNKIIQIYSICFILHESIYTHIIPNIIQGTVHRHGAWNHKFGVFYFVELTIIHVCQKNCFISWWTNSKWDIVFYSMNLKLEQRASLTQPNAQSNPGNHIRCVKCKLLTLLRYRQSPLDKRIQ